MDTTGVTTGSGQDRFHWGDSLSLWDVCRSKIIEIPTIAIYYHQANDKDLKNLIKFKMDNYVVPHIDKLQKKLQAEGFDYPAEPYYKEKFNINPGLKTNTLINDDEIAASIRELLRMIMTNEAEALRNATRPDVRELLNTIFDDDSKLYDEVVKLQKDKNWTDAPPYMQ